MSSTRNKSIGILKKKWIIVFAELRYSSYDQFSKIEKDNDKLCGIMAEDQLKKKCEKMTEIQKEHRFSKTERQKIKLLS